MRPIPINEILVWDYDIPDDAQENEAFLDMYYLELADQLMSAVGDPWQ
jgi:hypothetical protein